MQQLAGMDAGFLYGETPTVHMHTLKVAIFDPKGVPGGYSFEIFRETLSERLHLLPPFRRRLVEIPFGLGHPLWIEDPDFDIARHISSRKVAPPGDMVELCRIISEVAGKPLDRDKPLWEIVAVEGLENGCVAFVGKIHHCVADGVAAYEMLMNVSLGRSGATPTAEGEVDWRPDPVPSRGDLFRIAGREALRRFRRLPILLWQTLRGLLRMLRAMVRDDTSATMPFKLPVTSFNKALSAPRTFATTSLPIADLRALKSKLGVTLNDVVMALCAGALRRDLERRGALPAQSLVVGVPINTHPEQTGRLTGNRVGNLIVSLYTHEADPLVRVRSIHRGMVAARARLKALGNAILEDWAEFAPPGTYASAARAWSHSRMSDRLRPPINLVISNVRGPKQPIEIAGGRIVSIHSVGPILDGIGLNITAWSYDDQVHFSMLACPEGIDDPWKLMACFPEALDELKQAAQRDDADIGT